jgi:hypothetical protein
VIAWLREEVAFLRWEVWRSDDYDWEIIRYGGLPFTAPGVHSHADWANVRAAEARILARARWRTAARYAFGLATLAVIITLALTTSGTDGNGAPMHENCWTDPSTGQIVQCEGDGRN